MIIDVKNMKGEKVQEVELPAEIFEAPILVDLMHQAYVRQMANARVGTHETKTSRRRRPQTLQTEGYRSCTSGLHPLCTVEGRRSCSYSAYA